MMDPADTGDGFSSAEAQWMRRALRLADRGYTHPNPRVGCVIVRDGVIVGEGYHPAAGEPHAEVFALIDAGPLARGATAYVTLEPCAHHGRTPPCANALIEAGVAKVVAAVEDPNPAVHGLGLAALREAGIEVRVGLLADAAERSNAPFLHYHRTGTPFVALKAAMTLDGKIASRTRDSRWITGEPARLWVYRMRAQYGAVVCGIGTVLADDPLLTARFPGVPRQPLRVVIDPHLRIPETSRLVRTAREFPTLIITSTPSGSPRSKILQSYEVDILTIHTDINEHIPLQKVLAELGRRGIISVMVEGGGETHAGFLADRQAHRICWFVAPKLIGGRDAPTPVEGPGIERMEEAIKLADMRTTWIGGDLLIEGTPIFPATEKEVG